MKTIFIILSTFFLTSFTYQNKDYYFLSITTYNHAEKAYKGTFTYQIRDGYIVISNSKLFSEKDDILLFKKINPKSVEKLRKINLYNLDNLYFNKCIMTTSGNEYTINLEEKKTEKDIQIHHYYNPKIEELINELNTFIPKKYKIKYVTSDTKQDCI